MDLRITVPAVCSRQRPAHFVRLAEEHGSTIEIGTPSTDEAQALAVLLRQVATDIYVVHFDAG